MVVIDSIVNANISILILFIIFMLNIGGASGTRTLLPTVQKWSFPR